jgi:hypothetical protein
MGTTPATRKQLVRAILVLVGPTNAMIHGPPGPDGHRGDELDRRRLAEASLGVADLLTPPQQQEPAWQHLDKLTMAIDRALGVRRDGGDPSSFDAQLSTTLQAAQEYATTNREG